MDAFDLPDLLDRRAAAGRAYLEFLREPAMSAGLYVLAPGEADRQQPHTEDEVYVVLRGSGAVEVAGERRRVREGTVVYVGRGVEHRFLDVESELAILVVFGPPEYSLGDG